FIGEQRGWFRLFCNRHGSPPVRHSRLPSLYHVCSRLHSDRWPPAGEGANKTPSSAEGRGGSRKCGAASGLLEYGQIARILRVDAQDAVVTLGADETALLAVVRSQILVIVDAGGELEPLAQGGPIQVAGEIDPLATVGAP